MCMPDIAVIVEAGWLPEGLFAHAENCSSFKRSLHVTKKVIII